MYFSTYPAGNAEVWSSFFLDTIKIKYQNKEDTRFYNSLRHHPTVLSSDSPHQAKASPVIFVSEGTGGVTARTSLPSRLSVGNRDAIQTVCFFVTIWWALRWVRRPLAAMFTSVFAFIFQVKGQRCHICLSYEAERWGRLNKQPVVGHLVRHVTMDTAISTSTMLPSQHAALSKQQAGSRQAGGESHLVTNVWKGELVMLWFELQQLRSENHNSCGAALKRRL